MTFRPTAGAWLTHPQLGLAFVAGDAGIGNCGIRDFMFTAVRWPTGQRIAVVASSCTAAEPPGKPRLVVDRDQQAPCDV